MKKFKGCPLIAVWFLALLIVSMRFVLASSDIIITEHMLGRMANNYGDAALARIEGWKRLMSEDQSSSVMSEGEKMQRANDYFNQVEWVTDRVHWGVEDYWATPLETLATNGGDCEDFSVGKYFSLISSRIPEEKLRITYVKSLTYNQAHMVLAYYSTPSAEPLIMDNINKSILPASQRDDLLPIYSFSGNNIWLAKGRNKKLTADSMVSLPQWRQLHERMKRELEK